MDIGSDHRIPWTSVFFASPKAESIQENRVMVWCQILLLVKRIPDTMLDSEMSQEGSFNMVLRTRRAPREKPVRAPLQARLIDKTISSGDRLASNFWVFLLSRKFRRATDAGVWNGHAYEDVPATTIPM